MNTAITSPIYVTGKTTDGRFLLGGVFQMQDRHGFPVDSSFEEAKSRGYQVDWFEALCDCWLNDCLKFDSFVRQAESCTGAKLEQQWKSALINTLNRFPKMMRLEAPINAACKYNLAKKQKPQKNT